MQFRDGVGGALVLDEVALLAAIFAGVVPTLGDREDRLRSSAGDLLGEVHVGEFQRLRELGMGRLAAVLPSERLQGLVDARGLQAHEARDPVLAAQLI